MSNVLDSADTAVTDSPRISLSRRVVAYAPSSVIPAALTLLTSMIFTRTFSPAAFGVYSLLLVIATPVKLVFTTWLTQSTGKFLPAARDPDGVRRVKDGLAVSTAAVVLLETALAVGAYVVLRPLLSGSYLGLLLPALLFVVISSAFEVLYLLFPMENRTKEYTAYRLLDAVGTFSLRLLLVCPLIGMGVGLMFWSVVISNGVLVPVMWVRAGLAAPTRLLRLVRSPVVLRQCRALIAFGLPMTVWYFSGILLDVGDRYVLNALRGAAAVGVYDASYRLIAGLASLLVIPLTMTLHPYLMSISAAKDRDHVSAVIGRIVERLLVVGAVGVGVTALVHGELARILLGPQFRAGSVVMAPVLGGVVLFNIGLFAHKPFEIVGRTRTMVTFGLLSAAANVALCFALIPPFGYLGAAYATLLSYLLYTVAVGLLGRRIFPWRLDARRLAGRLAVIGVGIAVIALVRAAMSGLPYLWGAATTVAASGALAGAALFAFVLRQGRD